MARSKLTRLYGGILALIFGLIVLHAPLTVSLGTLLPDWTLLLKSWKECLLVVASAIAVILVTRAGLWRRLSHDTLIRLIAGYSILHLLMVVLLPSNTVAVLAGLAIDLRYIIFFALVYVLMLIAPEYRHRLLQIGVAGAVIVLGFGVLQLFLPADILSHIGYSQQTIAPYLTVDKNPDYIRINSTLRGPNPLGAYAVIILGLLAAATIRGKRLSSSSRWHSVLLLLLAVSAAIVLWVSYSRSALVATAVTLGLIGLVTIVRTTTIRVWVITITISAALIVGLVAARNTSFISNVVLHENPSGGSSVSSNAGHLESLERGVHRFIRQPLGAGVGTTGSASLYGNSPLVIENQYLFIAHETGWLGLGLFLALLLVINTRLWQRRKDWVALGTFASGVGLFIVGLLLPVWVDDTVSIIWWGLAAIALGKPYDKQ